MKKILVLNSGSSSLKYQLFGVDGDKYEVIAKGLADRIGIDNSFVTIKIGDNDKITKNVDLPSHQEAIREVFALLLNGALNSMSELAGVGHRIVQGGSIFKESTPASINCGKYSTRHKSLGLKICDPRSS